MNPRLLRCFSLILMLAAAGCAKREPPMSVAPVAAASAGESTAIPKANRALIVTVDMSLKVTDVMDASGRIRREAESAGGYVSNSSASGTNEGASASMELRVPADKVPALR